MSSPNLCKDCRWCQFYAIDDGVGSRCLSPQNPNTTNLVSGGIEYAKIYCSTHRSILSASVSQPICGSEGRWFEPKEAA